MKKIYNKLKYLVTKGYYYRLIITPDRIDLKLYLDKDNTSPEINYNEDNTSDGRYSLGFNLSHFITTLLTMTDNQLRERAEAKYPFEYGVWDSKTAHERRAYISGYKEAIEEMSKGWVSVEERLPETSGGYLCVINYDHGPKTTCMTFNPKKERFVILHNRITHWMPLPAPPSINKGEK